MPRVYQYIFAVAGLNQVRVTLLGGVVDVGHGPNQRSIQLAKKPQA